MATNSDIPNIDELFAEDLANVQSAENIGDKTLSANGDDDYIVMDVNSLTDMFETGEEDTDVNSLFKEEELEYSGVAGKVPEAAAQRTKKTKTKTESEAAVKKMSASGLGSADEIFLSNENVIENTNDTVIVEDNNNENITIEGITDPDDVANNTSNTLDINTINSYDDLLDENNEDNKTTAAVNELFSTNIDGGDSNDSTNNIDNNDIDNNTENDLHENEENEEKPLVLGNQNEDYDAVALPDWVDSIRRKVNANVAHAFLLNGNVRDYMVRNITIKDGIIMVLDSDLEGFDIIAEYDQAHGLYFYGKHIEIIEGDENNRTLADAYRERFMEEMAAACERLSIPCPDGIPNKDAVLLFTILSDMFKQPSETRHAKILLFIDYSDLLVPDASSAQMKPEERKLAITLADIGRSQEAEDAGNVMIFITDDLTQLSSRIRNADSRIEQIKIPIPDKDERLDFIEHFLDVPENTLEDGTQIFEHPESIDKTVFAINSAGLSRIQIEDIMLRALSENEPLTMQLMKERKQEIIKEDYDDVLEIIDPRSGFDNVGGMEQMKLFFRDEIIEPIHAGEMEAVPMGVLLMGPPGTGKTFLSKSFAFEAGMNFVALNLNRIMEKWVGSTERNLDRALDCAMAMAPTIIFIDEIDEALPNRADPNASSVNKRINQRLLTFFSDTSHRGQVMILAATNYPEKIDPAFKRAGRFDNRVPLFAPDEFDRMRIMNVTAKSRGYSFSWFESPDKEIANPFKQLEQWIKDGNYPINEINFVGEKTIYKYETTNELGNKVDHQIYLPKKLIAIIGQPSITLQQLFENVRILFEDIPERRPDANGEIDSDEVFRNKLQSYLETRTDVLGPESKSQKTLLKYLWKWQTVYGPFSEQTFSMTGAELDVVMNKTINLFRKWKRKKGAEVVEQAISRGKMTDQNDIPWKFLLDACIATINASAGIKSMEDMALLNTSDEDFILDALYAETDDGRKISYRERHEELTARQTKSMLG